jgi:hypothetical protein
MVLSASTLDTLSSVCHTWFLHQNQVLIVCMTQDQLFHTYGQNGSQITKCHEKSTISIRQIVSLKTMMTLSGMEQRKTP